MTVKKSSFDPVILSNSFGQLAEVGCMTFISITLMKSGKSLTSVYFFLLDTVI